jgi:hypothetical protein
MSGEHGRGATEADCQSRGTAGTMLRRFGEASTAVVPIVLLFIWPALIYWGRFLPGLRALHSLPLWMKSVMYLCMIVSSLYIAAARSAAESLTPSRVLAYVLTYVSSVLFFASLRTPDLVTGTVLIAVWLGALYLQHRRQRGLPGCAPRT